MVELGAKRIIEILIRHANAADTLRTLMLVCNNYSSGGYLPGTSHVHKTWKLPYFADRHDQLFTVVSDQKPALLSRNSLHGK